MPQTNNEFQRDDAGQFCQNSYRSDLGTKPEEI
jgi:hypothetical protein